MSIGSQASTSKVYFVYMGLDLYSDRDTRDTSAVLSLAEAYLPKAWETHLQLRVVQSCHKVCGVLATNSHFH